MNFNKRTIYRHVLQKPTWYPALGQVSNLGESEISGVDTRLVDLKTLAQNGRREQELFSAMNIHEATGHIENRISTYEFTHYFR